MIFYFQDRSIKNLTFFSVTSVSNYSSYKTTNNIFSRYIFLKQFRRLFNKDIMIFFKCFLEKLRTPNKWATIHHSYINLIKINWKKKNTLSKKANSFCLKITAHNKKVKRSFLYYGCVLLI